jgi:hypothetical protein
VQRRAVTCRDALLRMLGLRWQPVQPLPACKARHLSEVCLHTRVDGTEMTSRIPRASRGRQRNCLWPHMVKFQQTKMPKRHSAQGEQLVRGREGRTLARLHCWACWRRRAARRWHWWQMPSCRRAAAAACDTPLHWHHPAAEQPASAPVGGKEQLCQEPTVVGVVLVALSLTEHSSQLRWDKLERHVVIHMAGCSQGCQPMLAAASGIILDSKAVSQLPACATMACSGVRPRAHLVEVGAQAVVGTSQERLQVHPGVTQQEAVQRLHAL